MVLFCAQNHCTSELFKKLPTPKIPNYPVPLWMFNFNFRYQKQLQLNYVSMYKRNKLLETELDHIKKTPQQQHSNNNNNTTSKSGSDKLFSSSSLSSEKSAKLGGLFDTKMSSSKDGMTSSLSGSTSSIQKPLGHVSSAKAKLLSKFSSKFNDN